MSSGTVVSGTVASGAVRPATVDSGAVDSVCSPSCELDVNVFSVAAVTPATANRIQMRVASMTPRRLRAPVCEQRRRAVMGLYHKELYQIRSGLATGQRGKLGVLLHPRKLDLAGRTVPVLAHNDLGYALVIRLGIVIFISI